MYENFEPAGSAIGYRIVRKLDEVRSPFQKIEIYESTDWGNLMLIDGAMMLTTRDNFLYHEMMSHPALFTHANPKRVVIIGGGDCGTLREVLKHPGVESATQCDIDEQVTRMAEKWFPELCDKYNDPRAALLFDDGIAYMANCPAGSLDIVIVDSTPPAGPAEGRVHNAFHRSGVRRGDGVIHAARADRNFGCCPGQARHRRRTQFSRAGAAARGNARCGADHRDTGSASARRPRSGASYGAIAGRQGRRF
jgi:spermidine synthase